MVSITHVCVCVCVDHSEFCVQMLVRTFVQPMNMNIIKYHPSDLTAFANDSKTDTNEHMRFQIVEWNNEKTYATCFLSLQLQMHKFTHIFFPFRQMSLLHFRVKCVPYNFDGLNLDKQTNKCRSVQWKHALKSHFIQHIEME